MTSPNPPVGYYTPKLGLRVDSLDDEMGSATSNWDKLDAGQGAIWVAADVTPSDEQLYDGAIVAELVTGKVWRAQKDINGNYQKKWLKFPWLLSAYYQGPFGANDATPHVWGWHSVTVGECVNAGIADLVGSYVVVPVDGIYGCTVVMRWEPNGAVAGGMREHLLSINGVSHGYETETIKVPEFINLAIHRCHFTMNLKAGDTVISNCWQNAGANQPNTSHYISITCVSPI